MRRSASPRQGEADREGDMAMFYSSRFMIALSELEGFIRHQTASDEDAMFDSLKQSKGEGLKPAEAAVSYFITHARRGIAEEPETWGPITYKAALRARVWQKQNKVRQPYADMLSELVRGLKPEQAEAEASK